MPEQAPIQVSAKFPPKLACLFQPKRYKVLYGGRGAGRCLGYGTRVMMYDGNLKRVEDIRVGDLLMGPDSTIRTVLGTTVGTGPLFRVDQAGGGISYTVNEHHLLSLKKSHAIYFRHERGYWDERYPKWGNLINLSVSEYMNQSSKWKSHFFGYKTSCVEFGLIGDSLPIDPYFLGLWLGDGTSRELRLTVHRDDWEITKYCSEYVARFGLDTNICHKPGIEAFDVGFPKTSGLTNPLWDIFKRLELNNNKHVPWMYCVAKEKDRLALLAGLIDSDGYCNNNGYEFTNTNVEIVSKTKLIADFLGFKTNIRVKRANGIDRLTDAFTVSINGDVWRIPCLLPRKQISEELCSKNKDFLLRALTITPIGEGEYYGFEIDGDHLFLLEDGTVTHNSWGVARALLLLGTKSPIRVLCVREFMNSMEDSVHKVLSDQIDNLGLGTFYDVKKGYITGANGTAFSFEGIKNNTNRIKSYEGIDYCWAEEAVKISRESWGVLIPTIRKEGSEIWMTFNPELETDYTYRRFVLEKDDSMVVTKMTYEDNPYFPEVLRAEMLRDKERDPDYYLNVWEGHCRQLLEGAVYMKEMRKVIEEGRITSVPWAREWPVDTFWDLGKNNATAIWFAQRVAMQYRILDFYSATGEDVSHFLKVLQNREYLYGRHYLPHDARAKRFGTKLTIQEQIQQKYPGGMTQIVPKLSIEDGINAARLIFPNCYFDEKKCSEGLRALKAYRYAIVDEGNKRYDREPVHDWSSDAADAFRYLAIGMQQKRGPSQVSERLEKSRPSNPWINEGVVNLGWMGH